MARLGDICDIYTGTGFPVQYQGHPHGQYPFYKVGDIARNVLNEHIYLKLCDNYINAEIVEAIRGVVIPRGTVVFAKIGEAVKLNRRAITGCDCLVDNNAIGIKPRPELLDLKYFYHFMCNLHLEAFTETTTVPSIKKSVIEKIDVPLPNIEMQRYISTVLDKISDLITLRKQQLDKLDELVKARFVEMFGDPETNTKGWPISNLSSLCSVGSSKRIYQSEQSSAGIPFWRVSDLTNLINTGVATENLYISEKRYTELQAQGQVPVEGDILVTSRGTIGQCYIVKATDKFYFQDGMISWLSKYADGITPLYISHLFSMSGFRKQIDSMQAGSTVAYLSIAMIKKLKVMIPNIEAQQQFAFFVEHTNKSRLTIRQGLDKLETLKKALMQQYFG